MQRQLGNNVVVEVGYLGSISRKLEFLRAVNESVPGTVGIGADPRRPIRISAASNWWTTRPTAPTTRWRLKLTKRFSQGFTLLSSYTWSKSQDDSSGIRVQGQDTLFPQNSYCRKCEWALSAFDTRHRFVTSTLYDLPVGKGRQVDVVESVPERSRGRLAGGRHLDRAERLPDHADRRRHRPLREPAPASIARMPPASVPYVDNPVPSRWWYNLPAFTPNAPGTFGNAGRNSLIGPRYLHSRFLRAQGVPHAVQGEAHAAVPASRPSTS